MARGYYGSNDDGMDIARNAMGLAQGLGGLIQQGQRVEDGRRELADDAGIRQAYEHIAQRVGQGGNISALDGDPVMNSRHGIMAMGKFMADRANSEQSRLAMLKNMAEADDTLYQQYFRPLAVTAMDAYQKGDMRAFGQAAGQLSRISPFPYQYQMDGDGNFQEFFRSSGEGGFVDTGERITPQQVYQSIQGIMNGEQRVLRGMDMREHYVNPNFLAAAARYKMGTILGNAAALQDPAQWIPMEKDGRVVFAIPQNRHDDYSAAPSYRVFDETGKSSFMVANMDELLGMGYRPSKALADARVLRSKGVPKGTGGMGSSPHNSVITDALLKAGNVYDKSYGRWFKGVDNGEGKLVPDTTRPVTDAEYQEIYRGLLGGNDPLGLFGDKASSTPAGAGKSAKPRTKPDAKPATPHKGDTKKEDTPGEAKGIRGVAGSASPEKAKAQGAGNLVSYTKYGRTQWAIIGDDGRPVEISEEEARRYSEKKKAEYRASFKGKPAPNINDNWMVR